MNSETKVIEKRDNNNQLIYRIFKSKSNDSFHHLVEPSLNIWHSNSQKMIEAYYNNGKLNNNNGPAYIKWNEEGEIINYEFYLNGKKLEQPKWKNTKSARK